MLKYFLNFSALLTMITTLFPGNVQKNSEKTAPHCNKMDK